MRRLLLPALSAAALTAGLAVAQTSSIETGSEAVELARKQAREATLRAERLDRQAAAASDEADRARAEAEALIARIQAQEAEISAAQGRIRIVEALRARQRARLAERQEPVIRLTAALQTMAARPPALALVQPGSIDEMVRVRALLASTLPAVRARTANLRAEVDAGNRLREEAGRAHAALKESRDALALRRAELARLEAAERRHGSALAASALRESDRALAFGEEARNLQDEMRSRAYRSRVRAELAALPGPVPRPSDAGPAVHAQRPPPYRLPVEGRIVTGMGELSDGGVHARGLTFDTAAGAPVVAPRAGLVVYASRFRSYGEVVIIDHGGGWTSTIAELAALLVKRGDRLARGDPVGRSSGQVMVELRRNGRPHSIAAFIAPR